MNVNLISNLESLYLFGESDTSAMLYAIPSQ